MVWSLESKTVSDMNLSVETVFKTFETNINTSNKYKHVIQLSLSVTTFKLLQVKLEILNITNIHTIC